MDRKLLTTWFGRYDPAYARLAANVIYARRTWIYQDGRRRPPEEPSGRISRRLDLLQNDRPDQQPPDSGATGRPCTHRNQDATAQNGSSFTVAGDRNNHRVSAVSTGDRPRTVTEEPQTGFLCDAAVARNPAVHWTGRFLPFRMNECSSLDFTPNHEWSRHA